MKVTFLGTNGWFDTPTGNTVSIAIDTADSIIVLDAGSGLAKLDQYISLDRPVFIFLSHLHLDHLIGLHMITAYGFPRGLFLCGQQGIGSILGKLLDKPFTVPMKDYKFRVGFKELPGDEGSLPFAIKSLPLAHSVPSLGYRFELESRTIVYVGDTGYCRNAVDLAKDADLLITECAFKSGEEDPSWPHLNPESAARIAMESGAGKLALVHFDASLYRTIKDRRDAEAAARKIFPDTIATEDGLVMEA
jgi:ribonuclease BN (tRNA processing enzyme)